MSSLAQPRLHVTSRRRVYRDSGDTHSLGLLDVTLLLTDPNFRDDVDYSLTDRQLPLQPNLRPVAAVSRRRSGCQSFADSDPAGVTYETRVMLKVNRQHNEQPTRARVCGLQRR